MTGHDKMTRSRTDRAVDIFVWLVVAIAGWFIAFKIFHAVSR